MEGGKDTEILIAYFDALPLDCALSKGDIARIAHIVGCSEWYAETTYKNRVTRWQQRMRNKGRKIEYDIKPPKMRSGEPWMKEEVFFVQQWHQYRSDTELAKMINSRFWGRKKVRSWTDIRTLRHKMGWLKENGWTEEECKVAQFLSKKLTMTEISFLLFLRFHKLRTPEAIRFKLFQLRCKRKI